MLILLTLSITLVSCQGNLPKFDTVDQYFIRLDPTDDPDIFTVRCFSREYDLNELEGTTEAVRVEPELCNNIKGYSNWDSYIVPRALYIKRKIKRIIIEK